MDFIEIVVYFIVIDFRLKLVHRNIFNVLFLKKIIYPLFLKANLSGKEVPYFLIPPCLKRRGRTIFLTTQIFITY